MTGKSEFLSSLNLPNAGAPLPEIITAGQPDSAQLKKLAGAGVTAVIDLRLPDEPRGFDEAATARDAGLEYHNIPVNPALLGDTQFDEFRELLGRQRTGQVLVHCGTANRVGALLIPYLMLDKGYTRDKALEVAHDVGLRSNQLGDAAFSYAEQRQKTRPTK